MKKLIICNIVMIGTGSALASNRNNATINFVSYPKLNEDGNLGIQIAAFDSQHQIISGGSFELLGDDVNTSISTNDNGSATTTGDPESAQNITILQTNGKVLLNTCFDHPNPFTCTILFPSPPPIAFTPLANTQTDTEYAISSQTKFVAKFALSHHHHLTNP